MPDILSPANFKPRYFPLITGCKAADAAGL